MILPQDIFATTKEYIEFILYLYSSKVFTVEQIISNFNVSKWLLYKRIRFWEKQGYITIVSTVGKKGGKQYHYQATDKLELQLRDITNLLLMSKELMNTVEKNRKK
jgi:predicted transcriptional regulator